MGRPKLHTLGRVYAPSVYVPPRACGFKSRFPDSPPRLLASSFHSLNYATDRKCFVQTLYFAKQSSCFENFRMKPELVSIYKAPLTYEEKL
jgi:hypothetical protein